MYLHAYQSLVWNTIASRRIKEFGLNLHVGDLVYDSPVAPEEIIEEEAIVEESTEDSTVEEEGTCSDIETPSRFKSMVKALTEADIQSGKYTIFDVVLTLPGHDITYPEGECSKWYVERLACDDLSSEKFKQKHK